MSSLGDEHVRRNVRGSMGLVDACSRHKIPLVNISSVSAAAPEYSYYGLAKRRIEEAVSGLSNGSNIRAGVFIGRGAVGFCEVVKGMSNRMPIVPIPGGSALVWPTEWPVFAGLVTDILEGHRPHGDYGVVEREPQCLVDLAREVTSEGGGRSTRFLQLPLAPLSVIAATQEMFTRSRGSLSRDAIALLRRLPDPGRFGFEHI